MAENSKWYCTDCERETAPVATALYGRDEHRCRMCGGGRIVKMTDTSADLRIRQFPELANKEPAHD